MRTLDVLLKLTRQHERGVRNAWDIAVREMDVELPRLPAAFDGFTVLHLSDLHLDGMPGLEEAILERLGARDFDLCVLTGDYRTELHGPIRPTMDRLRPLVSRVRSRHGVLGVLGNHDDCHMVGPMEAMGIRMLVNESVSLTRGEDVLQVVGTDDVHYYFTDQAVHALEAAGPCSRSRSCTRRRSSTSPPSSASISICAATRTRGRSAFRAAGRSSRTSRGAGASTPGSGSTGTWWASPTPARARPGSPSGSTPAARS